jgi:CDP-2,3-bis-(O-geranylgeranyl)-sn-glycerol synthase
VTILALTIIGQLFYLFLPAAFANMAPVLCKGHLQFLNRPVDGGIEYNGQPLFGEHKTWRGLIVATFAGGVFFLFQYWLAMVFPSTRFWMPIDILSLPLWFGMGMGLAAILGDLVKSFFKRRVGVVPGATWFPFDQIDFLLGAGLYASFSIEFSGVMWIFLFSIGPLLHIAVNRIGFMLQLKETPW